MTDLLGTAATALLVVDVQHDFLDRPGLVPSAAAVVAGCAELLAAFRAAGQPVAHVRTLVRPDGADAMPHTRRLGAPACVEGSPGAGPPEELAERDGELVARKQHYRGFADPALDGWLRDRGTTRVVVAGLYTHACVRETALDAYERGYEVVVAADAVGSDDPEHAESTRRWLAGRLAPFAATPEILAALPAPAPPSLADAVAAQVAAAAAAQPAWAARSTADRITILTRWAEVLQHQSAELADEIVAGVGKPAIDARAEVARAVAHIASAVAVADSIDDEQVAAGVVARHSPVGVVALVMPWNNPLALPVGKIAPALALGNAAILKPAPEGDGVADLLMRTLAEAGVPAGLVGRLDGGAEAGAALVRAPGVDAVAVTGSIATGRAVALACARLGRPLQAELGGNNAAVVLADADLGTDVPALVRNAFAFAGQRCTAVRRFVVAREILPAFVQQAVAVVAELRIGDPRDERTEVGPMISSAARERVVAVVERATASGAQLLARAPLADDLAASGPYLAPMLLLTEDRTSEVAQDETFGPVAVIIPSEDEADAVAVANNVTQGLVLTVCTRDADAADRVLAAAQAGIVQWGPHGLPVHPGAPFGGWKASGIGGPEHGRWDADFFTRVQARYVPTDDR